MVWRLFLPGSGRSDSGHSSRNATSHTSNMRKPSNLEVGPQALDLGLVSLCLWILASWAQNARAAKSRGAGSAEPLP